MQTPIDKYVDAVGGLQKAQHEHRKAKAKALRHIRSELKRRVPDCKVSYDGVWDATLRRGDVKVRVDLMRDGRVMLKSGQYTRYVSLDRVPSEFEDLVGLREKYGKERPKNRASRRVGWPVGAGWGW